MKKIIVIVIVFTVLFPVLALGQTRDRVKIETYGFDNNAQALLFASKYAAQVAPDAWELVRSNPELVMQITAKVKRNRSWSAVDWNARNSNNQLRAIDRTSQRAVRRVPYKWGNGWARIGAQISRDLLVSRYVDTRYQVDRWRYEELTSTVEVLVYDPATCERKRCDIISQSIGVVDIIVKTARVSGYEPITVLESGDLSSVGTNVGDNLGNSYKQLLALAAFMESEKAENKITR